MTDSTERAMQRRDNEREEPAPARQEDQARVGKYGGDDGALEHEQAMTPPRDDAVIEAATRDDAREEKHG